MLIFFFMCERWLTRNAQQHVGVKANVVDIRTGTEQMTNDFRFTWCREDGEPLKRTVVPMTYQGACAGLSWACVC